MKKTGYNWFRFWHGMPTNRKVWNLTDQEFRFLIALWCEASSSDTRGQIPYSDLTSELHRIANISGCSIGSGSCSECHRPTEQLIKTLCDIELIKIDEKYIKIVNWNEWQYDYPSDHPTEVANRVKKHRESLKKRECNERKTNCNDTDTDIDSDTENTFSAPSKKDGASEHTLKTKSRKPQVPKDKQPILVNELHQKYLSLRSHYSLDNRDHLEPDFGLLTKCLQSMRSRHPTKDWPELAAMVGRAWENLKSDPWDDRKYHLALEQVTATKTIMRALDLTGGIKDLGGGRQQLW